MVSVRLPQSMEDRLEKLSVKGNKSKSELIKEALEEYLNKAERSEQPFLLGENLFGRYGSGFGTLSRDYKKLVRTKIHAKNPD